MTALIEPPAIRRVVVYDDRRTHAETTGLILEDAGYEPVILDATFSQEADLIQKMQSSGDAAICDHRLSPGSNAPFTGASIVAALNRNRFPAILQTQYVMDYDVSIRAYRRNIPVLLSKSEVEPDQLVASLKFCLDEIAGKIPSTRRPWRTLIYIDALSQENGESVADVFIPGWNPDRAVRFPTRLITQETGTDPASGEYYHVMVNVGAERDEELFFFDFERAQGPNSEDGLD